MRLTGESDKGKTSEKKKKEEQPRRNVLDHILRSPLESRLDPRPDAEPPQNQYAPLTKSRAEIFELHTNLFKKPCHMNGGPKQRSKDKFCYFHEYYGHDTEECWNLKSDIEELVGSGPLKKYQRSWLPS